jgi:hypothetical protein
MSKLIPTDEDYELGDAKLEEKRDERLTEHYDSIIGVGYEVQTPHGKGTVTGYEILHPRKIFINRHKPAPGVSYRYQIELAPGHTWSCDQKYYYAFDNEVQVLLGQF